MLRFVMNHCGNRLFEWCMAFALLVLGMQAFIWPQTLAHSNFRMILDVVSAGNMALIYLVIGQSRIVALIANGTYWPEWTPRVRAFGALGGAIVWGQMTIALFLLSMDIGRAPSPGIPVYCALTMGELFSCYRALAGEGNGIR